MIISLAVSGIGCHEPQLSYPSYIDLGVAWIVVAADFFRTPQESVVAVDFKDRRSLAPRLGVNAVVGR